MISLASQSSRVGEQQPLVARDRVRVALGVQNPGAERRSRWCAAAGSASSSSRVSASGQKPRPAPCRSPVGRAGRAGTVMRDRAERPVESAVTWSVADAVVVDVRAQRGQCDAGARGRSTCAASLAAALPRRPRRTGAAAPPRRPGASRTAGLAAHAVRAGGEDVGAVPADTALVHQPGQAAGAGQHAEQRHLGQRHRRGVVVDQHDVLAGQRQLVPAAGARRRSPRPGRSARSARSRPPCRCGSRW